MKDFFRSLNQYWQKNPSRNYFIIFAALAVIIIIGLSQFSDDDDANPCSSRQYFGTCYDVPRALCETTLSVIHTSCENQIKSLTKPGQLVGPIVRNCEQLHFDRILKYTRKSDPMCADRIHYLESWQKTNPDF